MSLRGDVHDLIDNLRDIEREIGHVEQALGEKDDVEKAKHPFDILEGEVKKLSDKTRGLSGKF